MLVTVELVKNASVERLVKLWAKRYIPDLSVLCLQKSRLTVSELLEAASREGRAKTVAKRQSIIQSNCDCAAIKTDVLFSYIPNIVNLSDSQRVAELVAQVYQKVLEIYQQQSPTPALLETIPQMGTANFSIDAFRSSVMPALELPAVEQLAEALEPILLQLQRQHLSSPNRRTIGFLTTQLHLSTELVLNRLTLPEQLLLSPYFKFVEEQVCIPWQRVCAAAAKHHLCSPAFSLVEQLLPASQEIAQTVYRRAVQLYPNHRSRRGRLSEPKVMASSVRDIEMFQGYLWLCVLEGSMAAVEQELLPLCLMVFPSVDVKWELVEQLVPLLVEELQVRVKPFQMSLLQSYAQAMQELFSNLEMKAIEGSSKTTFVKMRSLSQFPHAFAK